MKTSRISCKVPKLLQCKYEVMDTGEVFSHDGIAYIKTNDGCISLQSGGFCNVEPNTEVTMMEAELILKFRTGDV